MYSSKQLKLLCFEKLVNNVPVYLFWKDRHSVYQGCNALFSHLVGLKDPKRIQGLKDIDLPWLSEHSSVYLEEDHCILTTKKSILGKEVPLVDTDKQEKVIRINKYPLLDDKDTVVGILGIFIDISDQKKAERLTQEKIIADRMIQTLKALAGSLSHELRTPLAGIDLVMQSNGATIQSLMHFQEDVLAGREPWPVSQEGMDNLKTALPKIKHQLKNAEIIINLQLQSIHDKDIDTRLFAYHSMVNIVQSALDQYPFHESERPLVHFEEQNDFMFWGESHLMLNVLYNLIKNSLYFVKEAGKGEIFITFSSDDDYNYLHFKDTAQGMPPEIAANVFEKFYTKTRHGTGLGLAFCQNVMQSFKGDIVCQSEEGEYAEFILSFPKLGKQENN